MNTFQRQKVVSERDSSKISLSLIYPEFSIDKIGTRKININIQKFLTQTGYLYNENFNFDTLWISFMTDYNNFVSDFPDYSHSWEIKKKVELVYKDQDYISLKYYRYEYTGGAHPNTFIKYESYNIKTGLALKVEELLILSSFNELTNIAEQEFRSFWKLSEVISLSEAGFDFPIYTFSLNTNFAILDSGLIFYYNPYEITSYNKGATPLLIPFSECRHLLKETDKTK